MLLHGAISTSVSDPNPEVGLQKLEVQSIGSPSQKVSLWSLMGMLRQTF